MGLRVGRKRGSLAFQLRKQSVHGIGMVVVSGREGMTRARVGN